MAMPLPGRPVRRIRTNIRLLLPTAQHHHRFLHNTTLHRHHLRISSFQGKHRFTLPCSILSTQNFATMASATSFFDFKVKDSKFHCYLPHQPAPRSSIHSLHNPQPRHRAALFCLASPCSCSISPASFCAWCLACPFTCPFRRRALSIWPCDSGAASSKP